MTVSWTVRLVEASERDFQAIIEHSAHDFGPLQAQIYAQTLSLAIDALSKKGPEVISVKERSEIGPGIFTLHAAKRSRKASHFLVFRVLEVRTIEVLRILHERMDLARHVQQVQELPPH